jgi:hypothetical protein
MPKALRWGLEQRWPLWIGAQTETEPSCRLKDSLSHLRAQTFPFGKAVAAMRGSHERILSDGFTPNSGAGPKINLGELRPHGVDITGEAE